MNLDTRPTRALAALGAMSATVLATAHPAEAATHHTAARRFHETASALFTTLAPRHRSALSFPAPGQPGGLIGVVRSAISQEDKTQSLIERMIAGGNAIATLPYIWGGGHGSFSSPGYDCSGSVSYVLHAAGLLSVPEDSNELESYGVPGPGKHVTIYANSEHAWMTIDGRRYDTIALQETGTRWSSNISSTAGYVAVHPAGL